jgi:hypothetical protein
VDALQGRLQAIQKGRGMTPWDIKRQMDTAFVLADRYGFELRENPGAHGYPSGYIFLFAKTDNKVFSKEMVLNYFEKWSDLMLFFQGYEKADIAAEIGKEMK